MSENEKSSEPLEKTKFVVDEQGHEFSIIQDRDGRSAYPVIEVAEIPELKDRLDEIASQFSELN